MFLRGRLLFVVATIALFVGFVAVSCLDATTYYVDPLVGNDANSGLLQSRPWKNLPGTYRQDNTGPLTGLGWVHLQAGDTIKIRSGRTIRNRVRIDGSWYANGSLDAPITVMRDTTWGTGAVTFDGSSQTFGAWESMILVASRDYIRFDGVAANGIVVQNARGRGFQATGTSESNKMVGLSVKNMKLYNNLAFNVVLQRCDSFSFENIDIDGHQRDTDLSGGFMIGDDTWGCSNGKLLNCSSYNHGNTPGTQAGGTNARIGFWLTNSTNVTYEKCTAYNNEGAGFDVGVVGNPPSAITNNIKYVNCEAYNNSNGFGSNLDDISGTARVWYVNCISRNNSGAGWMIYDGISSYVYNCLSAGNTWGIYTDAPAYANRDTVVDVRNTIFYRNSKTNATGDTWDLWTHRTEDLHLTSDYNHFEQGTQATCAAWNGGVEYDIYYYNTTDAPGSAQRNWYKNHGLDAHSLCTVDGEYARFVNAAGFDFRLTPESSLIGKGTVINDAAIPEVALDRDGNARPANGPWDIGPYQTAPAECTFSLIPTSASFTASAGTGTINVTASAGSCAWTAVSNDVWITITSGGSGTGSGQVNYSVAQNTGAARTGTITIGGQTFTVNQAAFTCSYSISPQSQSFTAAGGTGSVAVTATTGCAWTAASNNAWVTITSGASGTGNGTVGYSVDENAGATRSGTMTVAALTFTVNQSGTTPPRISASPTSINYGYVRRGRSRSSTITVSNSGGSTLAVSSVAISGSSSADFRQTNNCSSVLPGASCSITATFAPTRSGTRTATLSISSNDPAAPTTTVSLRGIGY